MSFLKKVWGTTKKVVGGVMTGAGTVLSLLNPTAGQGVMTVGQMIGGTMVKLAGKTDSTDKITNAVENTMKKLGLDKPAEIKTMGGTLKATIIHPFIWVAGGVLILILLIRKK